MPFVEIVVMVVPFITVLMVELTDVLYTMLVLLLMLLHVSDDATRMVLAERDEIVAVL
jgi:hypothetical protein